MFECGSRSFLTSLLRLGVESEPGPGGDGCPAVGVSGHKLFVGGLNPGVGFRGRDGLGFLEVFIDVADQVLDVPSIFVVRPAFHQGLIAGNRLVVLSHTLVTGAGEMIRGGGGVGWPSGNAGPPPLEARLPLP